MNEREEIRNSLLSKKMLATLSDEELLKRTEGKEAFSKFIAGIAYVMTPVYVCYAYKDNDILRKIISRGLENNSDLSMETQRDVITVLQNLNEYSNRDQEFRYEFTTQYESIETHALGLTKLGMTLEEMDSVLLDMFDKINSGNIDDVKTDKNYLATVSYLARRHSSYLRNSFMIPEIKKSLCFVDKNAFDDRKEYKAFKRVASTTLRRIEKSYKYEKKNQQKVKNSLYN